MSEKGGAKIQQLLKRECAKKQLQALAAAPGPPARKHLTEKERKIKINAMLAQISVFGHIFCTVLLTHLP